MSQGCSIYEDVAVDVWLAWSRFRAIAQLGAFNHTGAGKEERHQSRGCARSISETVAKDSLCCSVCAAAWKHGPREPEIAVICRVSEREWFVRAREREEERLGELRLEIHSATDGGRPIELRVLHFDRLNFPSRKLSRQPHCGLQQCFWKQPIDFCCFSTSEILQASRHRAYALHFPVGVRLRSEIPRDFAALDGQPRREVLRTSPHLSSCRRSRRQRAA